jgi:hypothetical protein
MVRFFKPAVAMLSALIVGALATTELHAQGDSPPQFRSDYVFSPSRSCAHSASAACRRKPRSTSPSNIAAPGTDTESLRVEGNPNAVRVSARRTTIADVLFRLESAFNIRYRSSIALDQVVNGTYSGSLRYVISRVLDG